MSLSDRWGVVLLRQMCGWCTDEETISTALLEELSVPFKDLFLS